MGLGHAQRIQEADKVRDPAVHREPVDVSREIGVAETQCVGRKAGEVLRVDTGCVVAFQPSVDFDIEYVGKLKSALFGGEGLFFATLTGPGHVWLQSLPFSRLADRILSQAPAAVSNKSSD